MSRSIAKPLSSLRLALAGGLLALALSLGAAAPAQAAFGVTDFEVKVLDSNRLAETQAGAHPYTVTTKIRFLTDSEKDVDEPVRRTEVDFPPGLIGNPRSATECPQVLFNSFGNCPASSQVGVVYQGVSFTTIGLYNLVPEGGAPAQLGFHVVGNPITLTPSVRPGDYGLTTTGEGILETLAVTGVTVQLWGVPGDSSHDFMRGNEGGFECGEDATDPEIEDPKCSGGGVAFEGVPVPFLTNPADCSAGPLGFALRASSWKNPQDVKSLSQPWLGDATPANPVGMSGCDGVPFSPSVAVSPSSSTADSPSGLEVKMHFPQEGLLSAAAIAPSPLKKAVVRLPEGMTINPSSANGLAACADARLGFGTVSPVTCPDAAKLGAVTATTPLLEEPLTGSVYLRTQASSDPESGEMFRLAIVLANPKRGLLFKLPGQARVDADTGQVTAVFDRSPQQPVEDLTVTLKSGPRAALATPVTCAPAATATELTGWSGKVATGNSPISVSSAPGAGACPASAAQRPFGPALRAGSASGQAGGSSAFSFKLTRPDGEQEIASLGVDLPTGLLAKLAGTPYCSEAALASVSATPGTGAKEVASPSCPSASRIGSAIVGAGAGSTPYYADTGKVYLAGPYKGAPLSIAVVAPAVAGPFDLGSVVVRNRLLVDSDDAQAHVVSDPLPQIVAGVPLRIRDIRVNIDKPGFMRAPTNCAPKSIMATVLGASGASAQSSSPFQVGNCSDLGFQPKLAMRLFGAPPRRGGFPALKAVLTAPEGQANIGKATVLMPKTELLEQGHIRTICTREQWAADSCPAASVYGKAKAFTPLLDKPLEGNVYLRSNGGARELPDLVADLKGQIDVELVGYIDAVNARLRARFLSVPDAPVSKFVLQMQGGKKGLLAHNTNVCKTTPVASVKFAGQNGKVHDLNPKVAVGGCGKKGK